jgi:hypothetical protein
MAHYGGRADARSVRLPDGGYYSLLNVHHNLHCLVSNIPPITFSCSDPLQKRLHHYMYEDHYFPNLTEKQKRMNRYHSRKLSIPLDRH